VKNNKKNNKLMLAVSLGATVLGNWLGAGALAKNINPSPTLSKLQLLARRRPPSSTQTAQPKSQKEK
jgi:hypothetical protein